MVARREQLQILEKVIQTGHIGFSAEDESNDQD